MFRAFLKENANRIIAGAATVVGGADVYVRYLEVQAKRQENEIRKDGNKLQQDSNQLLRDQLRQNKAKGGSDGPSGMGGSAASSPYEETFSSYFLRELSGYSFFDCFFLLLYSMEILGQ